MSELKKEKITDKFNSDTKKKLKDIQKRHTKKSKVISTISAFDYADNFYKNKP